MLKEYKKEAYDTVQELLSAANLEQGDILVAGCSTSEISAYKIGSHSSVEIGKAVFEGIYEAVKEQGNRSLILEKEAAVAYGLECVNVVPQPKAGGAFATAAYQGFAHPVAVEGIQAHAGVDIGDTLIGMHLRRVAVPVRISRKTIGEAHVVCARTRLKFVGGERACYDAKLL